jgi:hypothetical protein
MAANQGTGEKSFAPFEKRIAQYIAALTLQHLMRSNLVREDVGAKDLSPQQDDPLLWVWTLADRCVVIVNPLRIKNIDAFIKPRFAHHLGTILQGRRVVVTNHRGVFVQVGYYPEPTRELKTCPLDLSWGEKSFAPTALAVPIGLTMRGPLWLSLVEMDAVLIGGARRMGKTNFLHGWIAALLQGGEVRLMLYDGKGGVEFARYRGAPRCQVIEDKLGPALGELFAEMNTRFDALKAANAANLAEYNAGRGAGGRIERIALIVDELAYALQEPGVEEVLVDLTARGGAVGIHPILATQRPSSDVVTPRLKGNLVTRIAFAVPDRASSQVVLDRAGAESIAKTPGRLLLMHGARLIEAQAFQASGGAKDFSPVQWAMRRDGSTSRLTSPRLSDREMRVARAALERDGWFRVREIAEATGESRDWVNDVAKRWQVLGWLTQVQRNASGHQIGRRVTPTLSALLGANGSGGQADEADEADKAD